MCGICGLQKCAMPTFHAGEKASEFMVIMGVVLHHEIFLFVNGAVLFVYMDTLLVVYADVQCAAFLFSFVCCFLSAPIQSTAHFLTFQKTFLGPEEDTLIL